MEERLAKHNRGEVPSTALHRPWPIDVAITLRDLEKAVAFEQYLKNHSVQVGGLGRASRLEAAIRLANPITVPEFDITSHGFKARASWCILAVALRKPEGEKSERGERQIDIDTGKGVMSGLTATTR